MYLYLEVGEDEFDLGGEFLGMRVDLCYHWIIVDNLKICIQNKLVDIK